MRIYDSFLRKKKVAELKKIEKEKAVLRLKGALSVRRKWILFSCHLKSIQSIDYTNYVRQWMNI